MDVSQLALDMRCLHFIRSCCLILRFVFAYCWTLEFMSQCASSSRGDKVVVLLTYVVSASGITSVLSGVSLSSTLLDKGCSVSDNISITLMLTPLFTPVANSNEQFTSIALLQTVHKTEHEVINETRYHPLWDVTIAGLSQCPVRCCLYGTYDPETPKMAESYFWSSGRESDGRFWIGKPGFLFEFPSNHRSISLSFKDIRVWRADNADHYYSWSPHCCEPTNI